MKIIIYLLPHCENIFNKLRLTNRDIESVLTNHVKLWTKSLPEDVSKHISMAYSPPRKSHKSDPLINIGFLGWGVGDDILTPLVSREEFGKICKKHKKLGLYEDPPPAIVHASSDELINTFDFSAIGLKEYLIYE